MASPANGNGNGGFIPRYGMIISTVGVVVLVIGGFWGAVIGPIASRQEKLEVRLDIVSKDLASNHLTIREHEEFKNRLDRENAALRDALKAIVPRSEHEARWEGFDRHIARIEARNAEAQKSVVPRDELSARLNFLENNFKLLSDRIAELRSTLTAPYPVREQIDRLNAEIVEQRRMHSAEIAELRRILERAKP